MPRLTPSEVAMRQQATGVFLPPKANGEGIEEMPVEDGEDAVYDWIVDKMQKTPGGLSIMDSPAIREAADAACNYHRVKKLADRAPLLYKGKVHPAQALLKNARVAKKNAFDSIGLNPKSRTGLRTADSKVHKRGGESVPDPTDDLEMILDATE